MSRSVLKIVCALTAAVLIGCGDKKGVEVPKVSGVQPWAACAVSAQRPLRFFRIVPVARHELRRAKQDLAVFSRRQKSIARRANPNGGTASPAA